MMSMQNKFRDRKGQSLLESALVVPIILLLLLVFFDLGRAVYYYSALQNSVREGARYASVNKLLDPTTDTAAVKDQVVNYSVAVDIHPDDVTVTPNIYVSGTEKVTVSASYDFNPVTPLLARMLGVGNVIPLNVETTMILAPIARVK